jgi:hypothetical protein
LKVKHDNFTTSDNLRQFCLLSGQGIIRGLSQELKIYPGQHYKPVGYNSARVMTLQLRGINPTYLANISTMSDQLTMWSGMAKKYKVRISYSGRNIYIEIPKPPQYWKQITLDYLQERHLLKLGNIATLGLGLQDQPMRIDFGKPDIAHLFIVGQTRSGKTNTQQLIAWELCKNGAKVILIDVAKKNFKWGIFSKVSNLIYPLCVELSETEKILAWCCQEIDKRANSVDVIQPIFIIIDELKTLVDDSELAKQYLSKIAATGGEFGFHLILSTQYPQINMLGSAELKRNVTTRLCGRVDDNQAATNALGIKNSGAAALQGYGDFLLKDDDGLNRLTIARIEDKHIAQLSRVETVEPVEIPDDDIVNSGPKPVNVPDLLEPEQVALALFKPMGINRLSKELSIGSAKAKRVKEFAEKQKKWAIKQGYQTSDNHGWQQFEYYDPIPY